MSSQTLLGYVGAVRGASVHVRLAETLSSGAAIIGGRLYSIAQVGSFVRIPQGFQNLFGIVTSVGASAAPTEDTTSANWVEVQLVGETLGSSFERGIGQHPNVSDAVHIATDKDLERVYQVGGSGYVEIGRLSSVESVAVRLNVDKLVTRHSAVLGATGSGKSTTVASLIRSLSVDGEGHTSYPSARILLLDIHGEYGEALSDIARVFRVGGGSGEQELHVPFWALDARDLVEFLTGGVAEEKLFHFLDKIVELKKEAVDDQAFPGVTSSSLTVDAPVPFSLKRLWLEMIDVELRTFEDANRAQPALESEGDAETLTPPQYRPHAMGSAGPYMNNAAPGLRRQLVALRSRMLDRQYDFMLRPGEYEPASDGTIEADLPELLEGWLGHDRPVTVLDLSGIPSTVLVRLIGAILKICYEALFWGRDKSEGGRARPLLIVMEEAHRYLGSGTNNTASQVTQRIVKEGRKYGLGAMVVSQRPFEVDETILSQCGTFFALRMSNPRDRSSVQGTLSENLASMMDMLPVLRTGEAIVTGEAATLPLRCRIWLPSAESRPKSSDPAVADQWRLERLPENYERLIASWRAQSPFAVVDDVDIERERLDHP